MNQFILKHKNEWIFELNLEEKKFIFSVFLCFFSWNQLYILGPVPAYALNVPSCSRTDYYR